MHKTVAEARAVASALLAVADRLPEHVDVVVCPPFTALDCLGELLAGTRIALGAQTMHWGEQGAFTGEISAPMLVELGVRYVILGHSERRELCGESDATVNLKVKAALAHGLTPIVAVGETRSEHEAGLAKDKVRAQSAAAFDGVAPDDVARCVVAYEPIWAIGTGLAEDPANADRTMGEIRTAHDGLADIRLLYGGSAKPGNIGALMAQPNIDGALVGSASLTATSFAELIANAALVTA